MLVSTGRCLFCFFLQTKIDDSTHRHTFKKVVLVIEAATKPWYKSGGWIYFILFFLNWHFQLRYKESHLFKYFHLKKKVDLFLPVVLETQSATKIIPPTHAHVSTHHHHPPNNKNRTQTCGLQRAHTLTWTHMDCGQPRTIKGKRWARLLGDFLQIQRGRREDKQHVGRKRFYNHYFF